MKNPEGDNPKKIAARKVAVARRAVKKHEPNQERSKKELEDRARKAEKDYASMRESVETSVINTYLTFADAILEGMR
jgi:hypothetical protein